MSVDPRAMLYEVEVELGEPNVLEALLNLIRLLAERGPLGANMLPGKPTRIQEPIDEVLEYYVGQSQATIEIANGLATYEYTHIKAISAANDTFNDIWGWPTDTVIQSCFRKIAPVLNSWQAEMNTAFWPSYVVPSSSERARAGAVYQWVRNLQWEEILDQASRRDAAVASLIAGRAKIGEGFIYAVPADEVAHAR